MGVLSGMSLKPLKTIDDMKFAHSNGVVREDLGFHM